MSKYRKYLVCYDIADNKVRTRMFEFLKDLGLVPLQKSAFWGELNYAELKSLKREAFKRLDAETDRMFWIVTQLNPASLKDAIGYENMVYIDAEGNVTI